MEFLSSIIKKLPEYKTLRNALKTKPAVVAGAGLSVVHKSALIHTYVTEQHCPALIIASDEQEAQILANDLSAMGGKPLFYPARDFNFREVGGYSREYEHQRLNVLSKLLQGQYTAVISCIDAATQYTIPPEILKKTTFTLSPGKTVSMEELISALVAIGYEACSQVEGPGQFSHRGGILDFFMPDDDNPLRIEFWGDEIDNIHYFDKETQRRTTSAKEVILTPSTEILVGDKKLLADKILKKSGLIKKNTKAKEILLKEADMLQSGIEIASKDKFISLIYENPATLFDYMPENTVFFLSEHMKIKERQRGTAWQWGEDLKDYFADGILCKGFETYSLEPHRITDILKGGRTVFLDNFTQGNFDLPLKEMVAFSVKQLSSWSGRIDVLVEDLNSMELSKTAVVILGGTEKSSANIANDLSAKGFEAYSNDSGLKNPLPGTINVVPGSLSSGMEFFSPHFVIITHSHIALSGRKRAKQKKKKNAQQVYSLSELSSGDLVVHSAHGIGSYRGIHKIDVQGVLKDYIKVEYAKGDMLYVPVTQLDLISKYIGPKENTAVKLSRLGGSDWQKAKSRVKKAVKDMAKQLAALYAERMNAQGFAFSRDNEWHRDFDAKFEYEETDDQLRCIEEIKSDMERTAPMDRLLCGDVGFGKTEVALRAAFKCISDSKQCAFLCPTTILAWQHYQTIIKRFDGYPVKIELLSRFRTPKQQQEIIKQLRRGEIDFVVGTHRLVQKDVSFHDIGLVIIDEEQRFGVAQKERFKEASKNVDVLTLSATPIPRTLNMAMSGIRDMSSLEEAPMDRHPVQTYVLEHDDGIINEAINKELRRGGQVFYLHNKVESIASKAAKIARQVPNAKVAVAHGKMNETELSDVWRQMLEQEINVLVCTTIIETGIDLPNANTLIIENADHMGLSQLHQLRGRVGRSSRRAYAYFTFAPNKVLTEISEKRLDAIREFTQFGAGFKIAMRDLELRGAGNILGAEQHGNMEDVGYDMYLRLLEEAVNEEKGIKQEKKADVDCLVDIQVQAHIPENYISDLSQRLDIYKRISDIRTKEDSYDVVDELVDRFGDIPDAVSGLIDVALVRNKASGAGIYEIKQNSSNVLLYLSDARSEAVGRIIASQKGRALLSAGSKPYISIRVENGKSPIDTLIEVFESV